MHMLADRLEFISDRLGFMIATNILFKIPICATCRLRNIPGKLANMSSASCSRTTSLRRNDLFKTAFFVSSSLADSSFIYSQSEEFASDSLFDV
jgi:hypothetical protein